MHKQLEPPTLSEGFEKMHVIQYILTLVAVGFMQNGEKKKKPQENASSSYLKVIFFGSMFISAHVREQQVVSVSC